MKNVEKGASCPKTSALGVGGARVEWIVDPVANVGAGGREVSMICVTKCDTKSCGAFCWPLCFPVF